MDNAIQMPTSANEYKNDELKVNYCNLKLTSPISWYNHYVKLYNKYSFEVNLNNQSKKRYMIGGHWAMDYIYLLYTLFAGFVTGYYSVMAFYRKESEIPLIVSLALTGIIIIISIYNTVIYKLNEPFISKNFLFSTNTRIVRGVHNAFFELPTNIDTTQVPNDIFLGPYWQTIVRIAGEVKTHSSSFIIMFYDDKFKKYVDNTVLNILIPHLYLVILIALLGPIIYFSVGGRYGTQ